MVSIGLGVELGEGARLQLGFHRFHADALGQRRVDLHRLAGDALAAMRLRDGADGAHIMQPVGQLDDQDADILAHRQHQLAEILRLLGAVRLQFQPGQLGDAIDQPGDFRAESLLHRGQRDRVSSMTSCSRAVMMEALSSR